MNPKEYEFLLEAVRRMETECACELPELSHHSLAARAERLLDCASPPGGEDRDLCIEVANRRIGD